MIKKCWRIIPKPIGIGLITAALAISAWAGTQYIQSLRTAYIYASQAVGIGTNPDPSYALKVSGAASITGAVTLTGNQTVTGDYTITGDLTASGTVTGSSGTITNLLTVGTITTGVIATEIYAMDQHVRTTDTPTFFNLTLTDNLVAACAEFSGNVTAATFNSGNGNYELFAMNQDVETTDAVTFATVDTGQGANELYDMDQNVLTTSTPTFFNLTLTDGLTAACAEFSGQVQAATFLGTGNAQFDTLSAVQYFSSPVIYGSAASGGDLQLISTSHATKGYIEIGGVKHYGSKTHAEIQALSCEALPCVVVSSDSAYEIFKATGTSAGQWEDSAGSGP